MPTYSQADKDSRQSSSGKSFFRRHKDKAQDGRYNPNGGAYEPSVNGSLASKHSKKGSVASGPEQYHDADPTGLAMTAGVITSIPYSSTSDANAPVSVDYLPREEHVPGTRRDPQPHQLSRGADFHQYPAIGLPQNGASHPTGPRPPPHGTNITMASSQGGDRGTKYQQWGRPGSRDNNHGPYDSVSTDSSNGQRKSFDGQSIRSQASSRTRESSLFSSDISSRTAVPSRNDSDNYSVMSPNNSRLSKFSTNGGWPAQQPSGFNSTTSFSPAGFHLPKPSNDEEIERMFIELMHKRGWQNLPEQARRQMLAYAPAKKWTLVHQDKLTEWQGEQKRRQQARQTGVVDGRMAQPDMEGTPEWYVKKILDDSITTKQLQSLSVSLRTQPIHWVKAFIENQGQIALTNVLMKINRRQASGPTPASAAASSDKDLDREYDIVKCLKALMNNKYGADDALTHQQIPIALTLCMISPRLTTRRLVSEVMTFLCHCGEGQGHQKVLQALDVVKGMINENGRFDAWMRIVEVTIDGRGKMGSLVGASEEVRSGGVGMENLLMEYAVATLVLVNSMVDAPERDLQLRCHIRAQFIACGIKRILTKMEGFQYDVIDKQIEKFRENEAIDYEDLLSREGSSMVDSVEGEVKDMTDPVQITDAIMNKIQGTRTQDYFISAMQHLLILRENNSEDRLRMFQLVDSMLSYVAMDRRLPDMDLKQSLNFTVQSLLDKLYTDSEARIAFDEATESRQIAEAALAERDEMASQIAMGADGLVQKLQKQIEEQQGIIEMQTRQAESLKSEIAELQRLRGQDLQRNELETRELYLMLKDAQDVAASHAKNGGKDGQDPTQMQGILDREKLMERLERNLERTKTQFKLEGKIWGQSGPSDRLRELREQMDDTTEADFEEKTKRTLTNSIMGSVSRSNAHRKTLRGPRRAVAEANANRDKELPEAPEESEEEEVVFEKPRVVELKRPKMPQDQQANLFGEMASKFKKVDDSDDEAEAGDGVTTGPTHPSLESGSPKTPLDEATQDTKFSGPPPPPPPPMPQAGDILMPGFSSGAPPPPPPPPPGSIPSTPSMPGFGSGAPPPPPPPPGSNPLSPMSPMMPPPPPGAPPLPSPLHGHFLPDQPMSPVPIMKNPWLRPKKKLKAFHWDKVDTPEVTVWAESSSAEAKEEKYKELQRKGVLDEVEKLFSAKDIKVLGSGTSKGKNDKRQLISSDMMRNFHVSMSKFKPDTADEVIRKIIHCDREVLDNPVVMDFLQREDLCTVPENLAKLMAPYSKDWTGPDAITSKREQDPSELTREDQIYLQTAYELHHYWKARMRALALTRSYEQEYDDIAKKMKSVVDVSESIRDSTSLMSVLALILDIGNYMNDSNKQASGFKLGSLARLGMVKDEKNESTFADLIERIVRNNYSEWEGFVDEIWGVVSIAKLNVDQLQQDAKKYIETIKNVQSSLDAGNLSDPKKFHPQDRVAQVVQRSMKEARRKAEQMQLYLDETSRTYNDIMTYFGEDNTDENARREFFSKLSGFVTEWKKSREKNVEREDTKRRLDATLARKRAQHSTTASGTTSGAETPGSPRNDGAMDSLLEKLRAAAPTQKDQRDRRRRARLKEKHQVRLASGQQVAEVEVKDGLEENRGLVVKSEGEDNLSAEDAKSGKGDVSESEDVADRALKALKEMRSSTPGDDEEIQVRRRREGADEERKARRMRRRTAQTSSMSEAGTKEPDADRKELDMVEEEQKKASSVDGAEDGDDGEGEGEEKRSSSESTLPVRPLPEIVVSPTTEETSSETAKGTKEKPVEIDD